VNDALGLPQSILVLGGGSEIARATVRALLAQRHARVVLGGREGSLAEAAQEARQRGATDVSTVVFDAAEPKTVAKAVDEAFQQDLDLVIVAFGVLGDQAAFDADPEAAAHAATVNYTSGVVAGLAAAQHLRTQGHGTIVALSSVAGERVRQANFVYGSTKAGLDGFFQGLGDSLVGSGARVMIVRPGFVKSRMTAGMKEAPFATDPDAVAALIVKGLAKGSPIVWAPAVLKPVFMIFRHLPRGLWRKMPG
jgi:decaprenylphospho-beta-D-erythro-pentofuranosid-2-ulose 2-reductase